MSSGYTRLRHASIRCGRVHLCRRFLLFMTSHPRQCALACSCQFRTNWSHGIEEETMDTLVEAVKLASKLHSRQRKQKSIGPHKHYIGPLMKVACIVQADG